MSNSGKKEEFSLQNVLSALMSGDPEVYHEVRFVAGTVVTYLQSSGTRNHDHGDQRGAEAFSAVPFVYERLPFHLIEILLKDAQLLVSASEAIQSTSAAQKGTLSRKKSRGASASCPGLDDQVPQLGSQCAHSANAPNGNNAICLGGDVESSDNSITERA